MNLFLFTISCLFVAAAAHTGLNIVDVARRMGLNSFLLALEETNNLELVAKTENITVFIPANGAFLNVSDAERNFWRTNPAYYQDLMRYHVVQGAKMKSNFVDEDIVNTPWSKLWKTSRFVDYNGYSANVQVYQGAIIQSYDHEASNGIIHVLHDVVTSPQNQTLLEIVQGRSDLTMIAQAVALVSNITDTLNGQNWTTPVTFLAPNDNAIKKLPAGKWNDILKNLEVLKEILQYHVLPQGTWFSRGLVDGLKLPTLNKNANVTVSLQKNIWNFDKAGVVVADVAGVNGVTHVVDTLVLPPALEKYLS